MKARASWVYPQTRTPSTLSGPSAFPLSIFHQRSPKSKTPPPLLRDWGTRLPPSRSPGCFCEKPSSPPLPGIPSRPQGAEWPGPPLRSPPPGPGRARGRARAQAQAQGQAGAGELACPLHGSSGSAPPTPSAYPLGPTAASPAAYQAPPRRKPVPRNPGRPDQFHSGCRQSGAGRGRSLLGYQARQPPRVQPTPPAERLSSLIRDNCSRGGCNCLGAETPAASTSSAP